MVKTEINSQILSEAISNENLRKVLEQIREIARTPTQETGDNPRLEVLLIRARAFTGETDENILATVKDATAGELDIILGDYSGEMPVVR